MGRLTDARSVAGDRRELRSRCRLRRVGSWLKSIGYRAEECLRLLDLLFVAKNEDGTIERLVVGDDEDFGALLASIVPLDGAGLVEPIGGRRLVGFRSG